MANVDNPRGLKPVNGPQGGPPHLVQRKSNVTTNIFRGDVVAVQANGRIVSVVTTTGSGAILGVAANHVVATASAAPQDVWVYDDPDQMFEIQDDGDGATPSEAVIGATFPLILTTGNTATGQSKQELDISGAGAAATDPLIVTDIREGGVEEINKYANIHVKLNRHINKQSSAGI